jgi:hypothetical protein
MYGCLGLQTAALGLAFELEGPGFIERPGYAELKDPEVRRQKSEGRVTRVHRKDTERDNGRSGQEHRIA